MTAGPKTAKRSLLLKTRLGLGATVLGSGTLLTAVILYFGMQAVASRLETALASETRMARYAVLSTQAATFLVIATESVQTGQSIETRIDRLSPIRDHIGTTFLQLRSDVEAVNRHSTMTHYQRPTVTQLQESGTGGEVSEILFFSAKSKRRPSLIYSMQIIPVCLSIVARRKGVSATRRGGLNWTPISLLVGHPCKLFHS